MTITIVQGAFLPVPARLGGAVEKAWYALGQEFARQGHNVTHVSRKFSGLADEETSAGVRYLRVRGYSTPKRLWKLKVADLLYSIRATLVLPPAGILVTNTFWLPLIEHRKSRGTPFVHVARFPKGQFRYYPSHAVLQTVSSAISDELRRQVAGAESRICVVPYPVSSTYLETHDVAKERIMLYAGRIHPEKGLELLIDAFARATHTALQGWTLRIIGPWRTEHGGGGLKFRADLTQRAAASRGRVEFVEPVFDDVALLDQYRRAAIFVYPSLAEKGETFGLAVLEAMAAGCTPIVSNLACFRDLVQDGVNGIIFNHQAANSAEELATLLNRLANQPSRLAQLGPAARASAQRYSLPAVASRFLAEFSGKRPVTVES